MFARPDSVAESTRLLAEHSWSIVAGGTDFFPTLRDRPPTGPVMDVTAIAGLKGISRYKDGWRIGALTTWSDLREHKLLPPAFDALKLAALEVGSVQIQNRATIVGNICNASPAADGVPPLLILDASVELASTEGARVVPLSDFILGNRQTARRSDELVTAILVGDEVTTGTSHFLKLGARKYLVISIAMVAARLNLSADGTIGDVAISVGSCSEVAVRMTALEQCLVGAKISGDLGARVEAQYFDCLAPIDDVRATRRYRSEAARELVVRTILNCLPERVAA